MALFRYLRRKKISLLVISIVILVFVFTSPYLSYLKLSLANPFKFPLYLANLLGAEIKALVSYRANLIENIRLKQENDALRQKLVSFKEIHEENARLSALLSFKKNSPFLLIAARVIAKDLANWTNSVLIDKGLGDGVRQGQLAVTNLGLVGRILEVSKSVSRVMLLTDPNCNIAGIVQRSRETGIVSGSLLGKATMRYLALDSDIAKGDIVLTLGLSENYPKGIIIGEVVSIIREENGISVSAIIKPKVSLSNLEEVLVIK
ncbi:MAG: rod shape-determining protein MreC [Candidatus Omnitrophota bacterium]